MKTGESQSFLPLHRGYALGYEVNLILSYAPQLPGHIQHLNYVPVVCRML